MKVDLVTEILFKIDTTTLFGKSLCLNNIYFILNRIHITFISYKVKRVQSTVVDAGFDLRVEGGGRVDNHCESVDGRNISHVLAIILLKFGLK